MLARLVVLVATLALALSAPVVANKKPGYVSLPLERRLTTAESLHRRGTGSNTLQFTNVRYLANFSLGGQLQTGAVLDTGSSNTWVVRSNYDGSRSDTYKFINSNFSESYGYGNTAPAAGSWGTDILTFGDLTVPDYHFGVIDASEVTGIGTGLFAMGPQVFESPTECQYPTLPQQLKSSGVIGSNAFSLFISKEDQSEATLILGGVDKAKYSGPLYTVPRDTVDKLGPLVYAVNFAYDGHEYTGGVLDSGTPGVLFPASVADSIAEKYGGYWDPIQKAYFAGEKVTDPPGLQIVLGGVPVTIPGNEMYLGNGEPPYQLGVGRNIGLDGEYANILGEVFLRQLFVVYDIDNAQIAFAPVRYSNETNIVAIKSSIPDSTPAPIQTMGGPSYGGDNSTSIQNCILGLCFDN